MDFYLALRLPYSDRALDLRERLLETTGHDISEHLELFTCRLMAVTIKFWDQFYETDDSVRDAIAVGLLSGVEGFNLPYEHTQFVVEEIKRTLGEMRNDLGDQFDSIRRLLPAEISKVTITQRGTSYILEVG